jgi:hypothetical protein
MATHDRAAALRRELVARLEDADGFAGAGLREVGDDDFVVLLTFFTPPLEDVVPPAGFEDVAVKTRVIGRATA